MILKNGLVFTKDYNFQKMDLSFYENTITGLQCDIKAAEGEYLDATDLYVVPGLIDIHTHGCMGKDVCDGQADSLQTMLAYYGSHGVTSVIPATMAYPEDLLADILAAALPYFGKPGWGAVLRGINMEGPYLSPNKVGAQNPEYIYPPSIEGFDRLYALCNGNIRLVDVAPELPGSMEFIRHASQKCTVSLAHTTADYSTALAAFEAGASHVTHLFNAMPPFGHREPSVVGAASDQARFVEVISDGIHLHPAVVRSVFSWFGKDRICLISDSMRGAGLPDGEYDLGGQMVTMEKGKATLTGTDTIAGSTRNLLDCCRSAVEFGIQLEDALQAATANPAKATGIFEQTGSLEIGKAADVLVLDKNLALRHVFAAGQKIV